MLSISREEIEGMERLYRNNFINSISGFKSSNLIGTVSEKGIYNVAVFSSVTHFGSSPAVLGFVTRPTTVPRNTYKNIKDIGYYTINHVNSQIVEQAHQTSAKYEEEVDEFEICGFTKEISNFEGVPYVKESNIQIGMKFEEEYKIAINDTILVLGSIQEIKLKENLIKTDGFIDLNEADTTSINGLDAYLSPKKIVRFNYARPNQPITQINEYLK